MQKPTLYPLRFWTIMNALNRPEVPHIVQNIKQYQARKLFFNFLNYPIHNTYRMDRKFKQCFSRLDDFLICVCPCKCLCFASALSSCQLGYRNLHLQHSPRLRKKHCSGTPFHTGVLSQFGPCILESIRDPVLPSTPNIWDHSVTTGAKDTLGAFLESTICLRAAAAASKFN